MARLGYDGPLAQRTSGLPLRFVYLGALMPHKGTHVAVRAFEGVDPARATLDIWGSTSGAPEYAADLRRKASASVRLRGALPEEDKPQILRDADVLVVPSLGHESFGIVVREAMAAGTPVLASRGSALVEAFEDGTCGAYFEPGNVEELRRWIERLCGDPAIVAPLASSIADAEVHGRSRSRDRSRLRERPVDEATAMRWPHAVVTLRQVLEAEGWRAVRDRLLDRRQTPGGGHAFARRPRASASRHPSSTSSPHPSRGPLVGSRSSS